MTSSNLRLLALAGGCCLSLLSGCLEGDVVVQRENRSPRGRLCLFAPATPPPALGQDPGMQSLLADQPLQISITGENCLRAGCDKAKRSRCSITQQGGVLIVQSSFQWEQRDGDEKCADTCTYMTAHCEGAPLPAGSYRVIFGTTEAAVTVPGTLATSCFDTLR